MQRPSQADANKLRLLLPSLPRTPAPLTAGVRHLHFFKKMEAAIYVALISGLVSLVVAYFTARYKFNHDRRIVDDQLNQRHLERIYGIRLDTYGRAFDITEPIRRMPVEKGGINSREQLLDVRQQLWEWKTGQVNLVMSKKTLDRFYELSAILKKPCENSRDNVYSDLQIDNIMNARNSFRSQLRVDLGTRDAELWRNGA